MNPNEQRLQEIFRAVFNLPAGSDVVTCAQSTTPSWDSMAHVSLIAALEGEFGISIDAGDSLALTSFEAAREYLAGLDA